MCKMKKTLALMLAVISIFSFATLPSQAASAQEIMPYVVGMNNITVTFSFQGTVGEAIGTAKKNSPATSLAGVLTIYENRGNSWVVVASVAESTTGSTLFIDLDYECISGEWYKAELLVTSYSGSVILDQDTVSEFATCP